MKRIALLIKQTAVVEDDNYRRFLPCLQNQGFVVDILFVDSLRLHRNRIEAHGFTAHEPLIPGNNWPACETRLIDHSLVWLLGLGDRHTFLDKLQLLYVISRQSTLINSPDAITHLKSKYLLATQDQFQVPETYADTNPENLINIIESRGGDWIVKPPAGSLGQDVYKISAGQVDPKIIKAVCARSGYAMLQRYLPEIEQGEKRVLLAGGRIISQYRRCAEPGLLTNLSQGGVAEACTLSDDETELCNLLAENLLSQGAWFSGVDLAYPWLIEVNVINPGGIVTIDGLTGRDWAPEVVQSVLSVLE